MIAPVLFDEGPLSRSDPLSGQSESWLDRGAPERSTARWLVERWEALRLALGAHGALPCEVGTLIPPPRVPIGALAPPTAPSPRAGRAREIANLGRMAPRECETMSVIPGRLRPCASEPGIQTLISEVQHLWIPGSRQEARPGMT